MKIFAEFQELVVSFENFFVYLDSASFWIVWISDGDVIKMDF